MPRRMPCRPTATTAATTTLSEIMMNRIWAAAALAFFGSRWPMYWLATTAPPVASALSSWIISTLNESTRLTPDTAASPTEETIRVSARPMVTLSACSAISGSSRAMSCLRVNSGLVVVVVIVPPLAPECHRTKHNAESQENQDVVSKNLAKF